MCCLYKEFVKGQELFVFRMIPTCTDHGRTENEMHDYSSTLS